MESNLSNGFENYGSATVHLDSVSGDSTFHDVNKIPNDASKSVTYFLSHGLCNQIVMISGGLWLASILHRYQIRFGGVLKQYNSLTYDFVPFDKVFNLSHLQNELLPLLRPNHPLIISSINSSEEFLHAKQLGFDAGYIDFVKDRKIQWIGEMNHKDFIETVSSIAVTTMDNIYVSPPYFYTESYHPSHELFMQQFRWSDHFYGIADNLMHQLGLVENKYIACHLRLEDDMIAHINTKRSSLSIGDAPFLNHVLISIYVSTLKQIVSPGKVLFLATGLGKSTKFINNFVIDGLRKAFTNNLIVTPDTLMKEYLGEYFGREISGLVEFIICERSESFIGINLSSFATLLADRLSAMKPPKKTYIIDLSKSFVAPSMEQLLNDHGGWDLSTSDSIAAAFY